MRIDDERLRLTGSNVRFRMHAPGLLSRALTLALAAVLLVAALAASLLVFAGALTIGLLMWGYLWWKARGLRKSRPNGRVIEGEVIHDPRSDEGWCGGRKPQESFSVRTNLPKE